MRYPDPVSNSGIELSVLLHVPATFASAIQIHVSFSDNFWNWRLILIKIDI
jgi:hypothetical protein